MSDTSPPEEGSPDSEKVVVIGAGQMGSGIAQVFAASGFSCTLVDANTEVLPRAKASIENRINRAVEKEKMSSADRESALAHLQYADNLDNVAQATLVIEAIIEHTPTKIQLLKKIDAALPEGGILASNTSSISITKLASATSRPESVIGLHFMNPVPVMQLVEVIRGLATSDETYQRSLDIIERLGKTAVTALRDYPGFIVNRILVPMINEAFFALMEGVATAEDIDTAMKLGTNQPMGPLELADFVGLDTCLAICRIYHRELGEDKYRPCPLLVKHVEAGWYGRKTGRGVYIYKQD